jgi:hypothetical protein
MSGAGEGEGEERGWDEGGGRSVLRGGKRGWDRNRKLLPRLPAHQSPVGVLDSLCRRCLRVSLKKVSHVEGKSLFKVEKFV